MIINFEREVGFIRDVDGVIVDSPHELAWRLTAEKWGVGKGRLDSRFYRDYVSGRPRYEGGNEILKRFLVYEHLGAGTDAEKERVPGQYCTQNNELFKNYIVFEDASSGIEACKKNGMFGVGIRRIGERSTPVEAGADIVVDDLGELRNDKYLHLLFPNLEYDLFNFFLVQYVLFLQWESRHNPCILPFDYLCCHVYSCTVDGCAGRFSDHRNNDAEIHINESAFISDACQNFSTIPAELKGQ